MSGLTGWIKQLYHSATGTVVDVADRSINAITALYHMLTNLGHNVGREWSHLHLALDDLSADTQGLAAVVYNKLEHIYVRLVPAAVRHAIAEAVHYSEHEIGKLRADVDGALKEAREEAGRLLRDVRREVADTERDVRSDALHLRRTLTRVARIVDRVLSSPEHLAKWAIGAIIHAAIPYADDHAEELARWVFRHGGRAVIDNARHIEHVLADVI